MEVYEQHDKAFSRVSAYVLMKNDEQIGTIAVKYPQDGAGRLYVYFHIFGDTMVRDFAGGYGYDKTSHAIANAVRKSLFNPLLECTNTMDSKGWKESIESVKGFKVLRAI